MEIIKRRELRDALKNKSTHIWDIKGGQQTPKKQRSFRTRIAENSSECPKFY
jgi:hypothetical protein